MNHLRTTLLLALGALCVTPAAFAQATSASAETPSAAPAAATPAPAAPDRPVRVRASHRVDVIAPGEKVETIIDRMRAAHPAATPPASDARPVERLPVRGPDKERDPGRPGPPDAHRGPGDAHGPPGGGPPAERPHR